MFKFVGYAIETPDEVLQPQIIPRRVDAHAVCNQNGLPHSAAIQLFKFVAMKSQPNADHPDAIGEKND